MKPGFPMSRGRRPLVLDAQRALVRLEGMDYLADVLRPERVALIAHWAPGATVSRSVAELVRALAAHKYAIALVSTAGGSGPLQWPESRPEGVTILRRPNIGYDFGSWATALARYPAVAAADEVLLLNDSLAGPFGPIDELLDAFHRTAADAWGLTDSSMHAYHLQSYCLGFKCQVLQEAPLATFWRGIHAETSRDDVIERYEIGLGRLLRRELFASEAAYRYENVSGEGTNSTIHGWRRLLDLGFPFVKRELLCRPDVVGNGRMVPAELRRRFGVEVAEWV
jgi:hypothetical protein